ncbi:hypothetical protein RYX36_031929 [Vicia faba]
MSSTQALADYATLIIDLKNNLSAIDSPVVVIGGSYGGMLAAWFRLKYPHIAIGALASSAPILQFLDLVSPYTFTNIVTQDYKMCEAIDNISTGNDTFTKLYGAANVFYNYSGTVPCFDIDNNSEDSSLNRGGWDWQACTEMILPLGGNNEESMFPVQKWELEDTISYCKHEYDIVPHWIIAEFGGAHHVDLRFSTKEDPEWLKDVRKQEVKIIASWISQYYQDL